MAAIAAENALLLTKADMKPALLKALLRCDAWKVTERDDDGEAIREVAELCCQRKTWKRKKLSVRVTAVRSRYRDGGHRVDFLDAPDLIV